MQIQRDGAAVVLATPTMLIFVPDLGEQKGWMITLSARWFAPSPPQPAFYGPAASRGCGLSICNSRVLWTTHMAPLLLDFTSSCAPAAKVRAWDLWPGAGSVKWPKQERTEYDVATTSLIRAMAGHQDWFPRACLTRSGAYLLGTLRGTAAGPDDPLPQSSQILVWEFGATALVRLDLQSARHRRSVHGAAADLPRPPRSRVRRRSRSRAPSNDDRAAKRQPAK